MLLLLLQGGAGRGAAARCAHHKRPAGSCGSRPTRTWPCCISPLTSPQAVARDLPRSATQVAADWFDLNRPRLWGGQEPLNHALHPLGSLRQPGSPAQRPQRPSAAGQAGDHGRGG